MISHMWSRMRRAVACWLALAFLCAGAVDAVFAQSLSDLQNKQNQISGNISNTQSEINKLRSEKGAIVAEMYEMDLELGEVSDELISIGEDLDKTNALLTEKEEELRLAREDKDVQYQVLKTRIRFIYEQSTMGYLDVLFSAKSFSDFLNRVEYINRIIKYDQSMVERLADTENLISQKVEDVAYQKRELEYFKAEQTRRQDDLTFAISKKQEYRDELDAAEDTAQAWLDVQLKEENEIKELIAKAAAEEKARREAEARAAAARGGYASSEKQTSPYTGVMGWPVQGYYKLSDTYRSRNNPVSGKREFHSGIDIPAPVGTNILAAESGYVIRSGWMSGYGNVVIVDHGNGITTLYGHNSKLVVSVGDAVSKGSVIAKCGSTGNSTGPHCHFEVRVNGSTDNPKGYLNF